MDRRSARRTVLATAAGGGALLHLALGGRRAAVAAGTRLAGAQATPDPTGGLWGRWAEMWNGNLALADEIIAPDFVAHFAPIGSSPAEVRGPEALKGWIGQSLAPFSDFRFETAVGPLVDGGMVAGRWVFRGTYQGGIPGAPPTAVGSRVEYAGIDIFRVEGGRIAEYWLSADSLVLLQQLGVIPS